MPEQRVTAEQKRAVFERARGCCEYCRSQARFATQSFSKTEARDPVSGKAVSLFHPRQQRWHDHFAWNDDFTLVIGLAPTGRATIDAPQLNRDELVNLRRVLYAMGEHPPAESG